jgi:cytochrome P450
MTLIYYFSYTMTLLLLLLLVIGLFTYLFYVVYLRPTLERKHYRTTLKSLGYKVKELPFKSMGAPLYDYLQHHQEQNKDAIHGIKVDCQGYDLILTNMLTSTHIILINMKLAQQMFNTDRFMFFPKFELMVDLMKHTLGNGLAFKEGDSWKQRRKLLSKTFNYDFLQKLVPGIAGLFDRCYD